MALCFSPSRMEWVVRFNLWVSHKNVMEQRRGQGIEGACSSDYNDKITVARIKAG